MAGHKVNEKYFVDDVLYDERFYNTIVEDDGFYTYEEYFIQHRGENAYIYHYNEDGDTLYMYEKLAHTYKIYHAEGLRIFNEKLLKDATLQFRFAEECVLEDAAALVVELNAAIDAYNETAKEKFDYKWIVGEEDFPELAEVTK